MSHKKAHKAQNSLGRSFVVFCGFFLLVSPIHARADLSQKQARKVIQTMGGWSLPSDSVRIRSVNSSGEGAEVSAEIEAVFRLRLFEGHWQLREIRTAPDRWERLEVIASAAKVELPSSECEELTQFATKLTTKRARCLVAFVANCVSSSHSLEGNSTLAALAITSNRSQRSGAVRISRNCQ